MRSIRHLEPHPLKVSDDGIRHGIQLALLRLDNSRGHIGAAIHFPSRARQKPSINASILSVLCALLVTELHLPHPISSLGRDTGLEIGATRRHATIEHQQQLALESTEQ